MENGLIGRGTEIQTIAALLDASATASTALIIEGEPGIGKSTLWSNTVEHARRQGFRVLTARTSAAESVLAYATLADLPTEVDPQTWADPPDPQRRGLQAALLTEDDTAAPSVDQRAGGAAFLAVVKRLAIRTPVLMAIDDVQWIDRSSSASVGFAARRLMGPVTFLCTARSDRDVRSDSWLQLSGPPRCNGSDSARCRSATCTTCSSRSSGAHFRGPDFCTFIAFLAEIPFKPALTPWSSAVG